MDNQEKNQPVQDRAQQKEKMLTVLGIVLCALLIPILVLNCILIVKSWVNKDEIPNINGYTPLIVLSDSMESKIMEGDVIVCQKIEGKDVREDYVIAFFDPASKNNSVVTHRVKNIREENGVLYFQTKGDHNNDYDNVWVPETALVGKWTGFRLPIVGYIAMFMQTTGGLLVCILVPLAFFIGYDFFRKKKAEQVKQEDLDALRKELEALKAARAADGEEPSKQ